MCLLAGVVSLSSQGQSFPSGFGATPYAGATGTGTTFRVWAGSATSVHVVGTFNNWNTSANPLVREGTSEVWSANIAGARPGHQYHFVMNGSIRRRDPRGAHIVEYNNNDSIIYDQSAYAWKSGAFTPPSPENMVIYELHVGTFNDPHPELGGSASLDDARGKLDYIASLGANTVKIMPVTEFPGVHSWGYNPTDLFAVDNLIYGGPDALKRFVDAAHMRGLAVILDIVHNHYGSGDTNDLARSLWEFDGQPGPLGGGMYFYQNADTASTTWGRRPDYSKEQIRNFIKENTRSWLRDFRLDGFRWDATKFIRLATNGAPIAEGASLLREVNTIIKNEFTNKISIAEDLEQLPSTTAPTNTGGLGFDSDWHTEVHFALVQEISRTNGSPDLDRIIQPAALNFTSHTRRVVYTESHDEVGVKNNKFRVPFRMDTNNPTSRLARQKSLLAAGLMMTTPGIPMLFQGQEMLETLAFDDTNSVNWSLVNTHAGIHAFYRDIIRLRQNYFGNTGGLTGSYVQASKTNQLITMNRRNATGTGDDVFVVANLSSQLVSSASVIFPATGQWYSVMNSDSTRYGSNFSNVGLGVVAANSSPPRGAISLAPWSFIIYARAPLPATNYAGMAVTGGFRGWDTSPNMERWHDHEWSVDLILPATNQIEFKFVANNTFDISWGAGTINTSRWPWTGTGNLSSGPANLSVAIPEAGTYRFTFNSATAAFTIRQIKTTPIITRHTSMAVAGNFNDFAIMPNLGLNPQGVWTGTFAAVNAGNLEFRFAAYGIWDVSWGGPGEILQLPATGNADPKLGGNLNVKGPVNGMYTFTFNDVTGQYTVEKTGPPPPYGSMQIRGNFNSWSNFVQMTSNALHQWQYSVVLNQASDLEFRLAANNTDYNTAWGSTNAINAPLPATASVALGLGSNIVVRGPLYGTYTITFDSANWTIAVARAAPPPYQGMAVAGDMNSFNPAPNMTSNGLHSWTFTTPIFRRDNLKFKFAANGLPLENNLNWGHAITHANQYPVSGTGILSAGDIVLPGPLTGHYTFTFNTDTLQYQVSRAPFVYSRITMPGNFNGWNTGLNLASNGLHEWIGEFNINYTNAEFKFAVGDWSTNWGETVSINNTAPMFGSAAPDGSNIRINGVLSGNYVVYFNSDTLGFSFSRKAASFDLNRTQTRLSGTNFLLSWPASTGSTYTIQRSTNLLQSSGGFRSYISNIPAGTGTNTYNLPIEDAGGTFYRVLSP